MPKFTLQIPMVATGPVKPRQTTREFQGAVPESDYVALVAKIIRDGLEQANYPEYKHLIANSDDWMVQQIALATAVPDDVWIRNGFYPLGAWTLRE